MTNAFDETITMWSFDEANKFITKFFDVATQYHSDEEPFLAFWTDRNLFEIVGFIDRYDDIVFGIDDVYLTVEDALELTRKHGLRIVTLGKM